MKWIIIPKGKEKPFRRQVLERGKGFDAVELASGDYGLPLSLLAEIKKYPAYEDKCKELESFTVVDDPEMKKAEELI